MAASQMVATLLIKAKIKLLQVFKMMKFFA